jgi:hypothetical protein
MTNHPSEDPQNQAPKDTSSTPNRQQEDQTRKPKERTPDAADSQNAEDEQQRQLETGEENPT